MLQIQYQMTPQEAETYRLAKIWSTEARKMFPDERLPRLTTKSDPRKCLLFRQCWKFIRETRGILDESEWKDYIHANLLGVKKYNGRVEPGSLCGDRAWYRWKLYKYLIEKKTCELNNAPPPPNAITTSPKIVNDLESTKRFLFEKYDGQFTRDKFKELYENGLLKLWVAKHKIAHEYVVLSPTLNEIITDMKAFAKDCWFDYDLIKSKITPDVIEHFKREFGYEFTG